MPGMEDEPSSTFNDLSLLMQRLGIECSEDEPDAEESVTWKEKDSGRLQEQLNKKDEEKQKPETWREERNKSTPEIGKILYQ